MSFRGMTEHIAFWEDLAPETITWASNTKRTGGIAVTHVDAALAIYNEKYRAEFHEFIQETSFLLKGAWLDYCLKQMTLLLLTKFNSPSVTINTNYAVMHAERLQPNHTREIITASERLEQFLVLHPQLRILADSGRLSISS